MKRVDGDRDEAERLEALRHLELLDTPPEPDFDEIVKLASQVCGTPISMISLVDAERQWFKAAIGIDVRETARSVSFCSHAIRQPDLFVVEDASCDSRFRENTLVWDSPGIRFYAGVPLFSDDDHALGTLCVMDTVSRVLSDSQRESLLMLGRQVQLLLTLRGEQRRLQTALRETEALSNAIREKNSALETSKALFEAFLDHSSNPCFLKTEDGRYLFYNASMAELFGIDQDVWIGKGDIDVMPANLAAEFRENDLHVLRTGVTAELVERVVDAQGKVHQYRSRKFTFQDGGGRKLLGGVAVDITEELQRQEELEQANRQLEKLATTDALTGLANRRIFESQMLLEFATARRKGRALSLLVMDVDNFKARNDAFGHAAGDEALRLLGEALTNFMRIGDTAARIGGEEFAVLLPETDGPQAVSAAQRLQERLREIPSGPMPLTMSIGVATIAPSTASADHLQTQADGAMYSAKRAGKDRLVLYQALEVVLRSVEAESVDDALPVEACGPWLEGFYLQ